MSQKNLAVCPDLVGKMMRHLQTIAGHANSQNFLNLSGRKRQETQLFKSTGFRGQKK
jgi:hypothetical protein